MWGVCARIYICVCVYPPWCRTSSPMGKLPYCDTFLQHTRQPRRKLTKTPVTESLMLFFKKFFLHSNDEAVPKKGHLAIRIKLNNRSSLIRFVKDEQKSVVGWMYPVFLLCHHSWWAGV